MFSDNGEPQFDDYTPLASDAAELTQFCLYWQNMLKNGGSFDIMMVRFCTVVEQLFGPKSPMNLFDVRSRDDSGEFNAVCSLLGVRGPVFQCIDQLLFCSELPLIVESYGDGFRFRLRSERFSPFDSGVVGGDVTTMTVNAFEAYFLFFLWHVTKANPIGGFCLRYEEGDDSTCAYLWLLNDYFSTFFPSAGTRTPLSFAGGDWGLADSLSTTLSSVCHHQPESATSRSIGPLGLLRLSSGDEDASKGMEAGETPYGAGLASAAVMNVMSSSRLTDGGGSDFGKMYKLFSMVCDMWLCGSSSTSSRVTCSNRCRDPSCLLYAVRSFVVAMHRFLYFSPSPSPLSDLKTGVLQPNLRRRMVDLFEYHFCRWPLDASFRSLLETWLAYIQPWRAGNIGPRPLPNPTTTTTRIHVKWTTFMRENKHVYETFFRLTLLRFARMDFGRNVKNVYLIHRLCEVFNQDGFFDLLKKTSADTVANIDVNNVGSYLEGRDPLVKPQSFWTCQDTGSLVSNVVALIETELSMARSYLEDLRASERSLDWPQFLYSYFFQPSTELKAETLQVTRMLTFCSEVLQNLFEISRSLVNSAVAKTAVTRRSTRITPALWSTPPEFTTDESGRWRLTPIGRKQVLYKLARVDSEHLVMSSPDAPVVDCDEFPLVGDVLDMMSRLINFRCTSFFEQLYAKRGWVGKLAHHFLEAPTVKQVRVEEEQKDSASQREAFPRTSPPRISLRRFSSVRFLFHLSVFVLAVFLLFRWNPLYIFFMYVAVRILLSCVLCLLME